jgi:adenylylsulfate kinase
MRQGFSVWLTGLPASGKSTIAEALHRELTGRGANVAVLESDAQRRILTPNPGYSDAGGTPSTQGWPTSEVC